MKQKEIQLGTWMAILSAAFEILWFITVKILDVFQAVQDWRDLETYTAAYKILRLTLIYPSLILALN